MRERLRYFDTIGAILWLFRAVIIVLVIYGSFRSLQIGKYTSAHWLNFIRPRAACMPLLRWVTLWCMVCCS